MVEESQVQPQSEDELSAVRDEDKTREQLINDLVALRQRLAELEAQVAQSSIQFSIKSNPRSRPTIVLPCQPEPFIANIAQTIRQSLDLQQMLNIAVEEVRNFLQVDRVVVYRFHNNWSGKIVAESVNDASLSLLNQEIYDPCFGEWMASSYQEGRIHHINDIAAANLNPCYVQLLTELNVQAVLVIPILVRQELWGLLVAHQCTSPRQWQELNWLLLQQLSVQLAIGIHQAELYQATQNLNNQLEHQVQSRTAQLQQALEFEALLKRITDKVRDSLDETYILQTAVEELTTGLNLRGCDVALYDLNQQTTTICREYLHEDVPPAQGRVVNMADAPDLYAQLLNGDTTQFCYSRTPWSVPHQFRQNLTILACPMIDHRKVIGDMWLFKVPESDFDSLEIRLVQQVANQCAIALRQSRLYQTAQAQVRELERLNQLKDAFLSTVSHELRTPMSNIKMATRMLGLVLFGEDDPLISDGLISDATVNDVTSGEAFTESEFVIPAASLMRLRRYFRVLQDECQREIGLITDLLDLSQLESEANPLLLSAIDLRIWLPQLAATFNDQLQLQQIQLQIQLPESLPIVTSDLRYLERIFAELLTNACKYTPAGAEIIISVALLPDRPQVLMQVINSGVEIPEAERDRIFETFYRIPNTDPWRYSGTGLGLALVKKLVERLRGSVTVDSGNGQTRFTVRLPLQYHDAA